MSVAYCKNPECLNIQYSGELEACPKCGDPKPQRMNISWTCVDCKQVVQGVTHLECPGKENRTCKNCNLPEDQHYYEFCEPGGPIGCDEFEPVKYAGGVSSPERERELYQEAMHASIPREEPKS